MPTPLARSILLAFRAGAAACLVAVTVGCWEEIKYEPSPESVQTPQETETPSIEAATGESAEPVAATPAETPSLPTTPPATPLLAEPPPSGTPLDTADRPPFPEPTPGEESGAASPETPPEATAAQRLLLWKAASKWSLAAAMFAKQLPAERFEPIRTEAVAAAEQLEIVLPPLPTAVSEQSSEQAVIAALTGAPATEVVAAASQRYGAAAGAVAELAIRSNLLLLTYSPRRNDVAAQAAGFTAIAEATELPRDVWAPLAKLLNEGGDYVDVRAAVFKLHSDVEKVLAAPAVD